VVDFICPDTAWKNHKSVDGPGKRNDDDSSRQKWKLGWETSTRAFSFDVKLGTESHILLSEKTFLAVVANFESYGSTYGTGQP